MLDPCSHAVEARSRTYFSAIRNAWYASSIGGREIAHLMSNGIAFSSGRSLSDRATPSGLMPRATGSLIFEHAPGEARDRRTV